MRTHTRFIVIALFTSSGAVACGDVAGPTPSLSAQFAATVTAEAIRLPFYGRVVGELTAVPPFAPGSSDECNRNFSGDPSAPGPSISLFDHANGSFSPIGRIKLDALSCFDPASPTSAGTGTMTAANGDKLFIAFQNTSQPDPSDPSRLSARGPQWVTGGTGRFRNASGRQWCSFSIVLLSQSTGRIEGSCEGFLVIASP
ncbi:MAG: hypothetical protein ACRENH_17215 [Gemmatimonadaceae bacterium]